MEKNELAAFWNKKFAGEEHFYGLDPNRYLETNASLFAPGENVICLGEGEGRNAVFLAKRGCAVTALDISRTGLEKTAALAEKAGVNVATLHSDIAHWHQPGCYHKAVATYLHLTSPLREEAVEKIVYALKPGGFFLGEFFSVNQLGRTSGGPKDPDLLYTVESFREALGHLPVEVEHLAEEETELNEGTGHVGMAMVIRIIFRRK